MPVRPGWPRRHSSGAGFPTTPFAPPGDALPDGLVDRVAPWIERRIYGQRDYLPEPVVPMMALLASCKEPMTADGIVDLIRTGRGAFLVDGARIDADHVITATGYRLGLESPGLGFVGFRIPLTGTLWAIERDARTVATTLLP